MAADVKLVSTADFTDSLGTSPMAARQVDFITRFQNNWEGLREIMGVSRPVKKVPGTMISSKIVTGSLENSPAEGEVIPYSNFTVKEVPYENITIEKYRKGVTMEAIKDYGYEVAVQKTDDEMLFELTQKVSTKFFNYLNTGSLSGNYDTFQMALAMAKGMVENKFKKMHKGASGVVGFVNTLDFYEYLGSANITVQTAFGFTYIKDFMGYKAIFLLSDDEVARGKVLATPAENIVFYYVDPSDSDFAKAGLNFTTAGETNLIGVHTEGNYNTAVSDIFAIMGVTLFAEYLDGIANVTFPKDDDEE